MTWLLPYPFFSLLLLCMWLLLNQSMSVGQILLGAVMSIVGGWVLTAVQPPSGHVRRPGAIIKLSFIVLIDIVRSNFAVARIILGRRPRHMVSGFMEVPLDLRNEYALAVLACILSSTPGTLWVNFNPGTGQLLIHVLDFVDQRTWVDTIKGRYERLLLEIFE